MTMRMRGVKGHQGRQGRKGLQVEIRLWAGEISGGIKMGEKLCKLNKIEVN